MMAADARGRPLSHKRNGGGQKQIMATLRSTFISVRSDDGAQTCCFHRVTSAHTYEYEVLAAAAHPPQLHPLKKRVCVCVCACVLQGIQIDNDSTNPEVQAPSSRAAGTGQTVDTHTHKRGAGG